MNRKNLALINREHSEKPKNRSSNFKSQLLFYLNLEILNRKK